MNDPLPSAHGRNSSHIVAAWAAVLLLLLLPGSAAADAHLISSVPADGEMLTVLPAEAVLTFDQDLLLNSSFDILDAARATVASGAHDPGNPTTIRGPLPDLAPGVYTVRWTALSADGHVPRGTFTFTVAEPTPAPPTATPAPTDETSAEPTPSSTPSPTPAPSPSPSGDAGNGGSSTDVLMPIAATVILVGAGLVFFLRRRGPA